MHRARSRIFMVDRCQLDARTPDAKEWRVAPGAQRFAFRIGRPRSRPMSVAQVGANILTNEDYSLQAPIFGNLQLPKQLILDR
jgi:hypothetical protein